MLNCGRNIEARSPRRWPPGGGELVFRGKRLAALAGENPHPDIVAIRFPSVTALNGWFTSVEYQSLIPLRQQAAEIVLLSYEA